MGIKPVTVIGVTVYRIWAGTMWVLPRGYSTALVTYMGMVPTSSKRKCISLPSLQPRSHAHCNQPRTVQQQNLIALARPVHLPCICSPLTTYHCTLGDKKGMLGPSHQTRKAARAGCGISLCCCSVCRKQQHALVVYVCQLG